MCQILCLALAIFVLGMNDVKSHRKKGAVPLDSGLVLELELASG
jgi:hypothetical protein